MALKNLREQGFNAVAFERRESVGGLWAYSDNTDYTTALDDTTVNVSKFVVSSKQTTLSDHSPCVCSPVLATFQCQKVSIQTLSLFTIDHC